MMLWWLLSDAIAYSQVMMVELEAAKVELERAAANAKAHRNLVDSVQLGG